MTIFLDSANINEIRKYKDFGIIRGITTNQKIFLEEKGINFEERIKQILLELPNLPVSVELTKTNLSNKDLIDEAISYCSLQHDKSWGYVVVKVPMWGDGRGLKIAKLLQEEDIPVNLTCCMSVNQAILACELGVEFVSFFYNRIVDYHKKSKLIAKNIIETTRNILDLQNYKTKIICGSIRQPEDVEDCFESGAHIVTIPPQILEKLPFHSKTEETIKEFDECWKKFKERS